jgi:hypothetical protein
MLFPFDKFACLQVAKDEDGAAGDRLQKKKLDSRFIRYFKVTKNVPRRHHTIVKVLFAKMVLALQESAHSKAARHLVCAAHLTDSMLQCKATQLLLGGNPGQ